MNKRPTIRDVAQAAHVHYATVSLALRDHPRIPSTTRDRIKSVAKSIGYRQDEVSSALARFRSHGRSATPPAIVFLSNRPSEESLLDMPHMRLFVEGARNRAHRLGYRFELLVVGERASARSEIEPRLRDCHAKGIILGAIMPPFEPIQLDWSDYAVVRIDSRFFLPESTVITNDQQANVRLAYQRLRQKGYCRIGLAIGRIDDTMTHGLYRGGYYLEQRLANHPRLPLCSLETDASDAEHLQTMRDWISSHQLDAIMCNWSHIPGLLAASGTRIPQKIAFCNLCLNDSRSGISGVLQPHQRVGERAVEALAGTLMSHSQYFFQESPLIYVTGSWVEGHSTPSLLCQ